jgi:hypothetical protein
VTEEFAILMKIRIFGVRPTGTNVDTPAIIRLSQQSNG